MMNEQMRVSDADRERVAARLRDHYVEGRLSAEELEERITAALSARTAGDLHRVLADLPEPQAAGPTGPAVSAGWPGPGWAGPGRAGPGGTGPARAGRRPLVAHPGPRILPLVLIALVAALVLPGAGWVLFAFVKVLLLFWLVAWLAGRFAAARFARRARRRRESGSSYWQDRYHV